jgi:heat shock protein HtpX
MIFGVFHRAKLDPTRTRSHLPFKRIKTELVNIMAWVKRIVLFMAVNFLVMITISLLLNLLGVRPYLNAYGLDYQQLAAFCLVWGMGGAFVSLALSRVMAKWMMGVQVIDPNVRDSELQALVQTVHNLARAAGLPKMPQVGIYNSPEVNAFATGPTKSRALVAVSTGLLQRMRQDELEGVLGHEISHVANGDMVTMTLLQGVVNAFVMFLSRVVAYAIMQAMRGERDERDRGGMNYMAFHAVSFALEIVFMIMGSIVVASFSRWREFRADAGGARLAGRQSMINALARLQQTYELVDTNAQPAVQTLKIAGRGTGLMRFFASHPPLDVRIARLQSAG